MRFGAEELEMEQLALFCHQFGPFLSSLGSFPPALSAFSQLVRIFLDAAYLSPFFLPRQGRLPGIPNNHHRHLPQLSTLYIVHGTLYIVQYFATPSHPLLRTKMKTAKYPTRGSPSRGQTQSFFLQALLLSI